jgi:hypothetical protein
MEQELQTKIQTPIHWGHFAMVVGVAVTLLGVTWLKNPEGFLPEKKQTTVRADLPKYYAYVQPAEFDGPQVAGASTANSDLPSVLNEDGSVTQVISLGEVLGVTTEDLDSQALQVNITELPDTDANIREYFSWTQNQEMTALDGITIENALSTSDQNLLNQEADKFEKIKNDLLSKSAPKSLVRLHKLKILQYQAGINLLRRFTKADEFPEEVSKDLGIFAQAQQEMENEAAAMNEKFKSLLQQAVLSPGQEAISGGGQ